MKADELVKVIKAAAQSGVASLQLGDINIVFKEQLPVQSKRAAAQSVPIPPPVPKDLATTLRSEEEAEAALEQLMYEDYEQFEREMIRKAASA